MKKFWKITLITLGSILGLVAITVAVVCWLLFTPARLTSIVNRLTNDYLTCESHFEKVDLTFFKTYPNLGVDVKNMVLVNPYTLPKDNALVSKTTPNDTLAHIGSLAVGIDLKAFLKDRSIVVRQLRLDDTRVSLYTAPDGWYNWGVFKSSEKDISQTGGSSFLPENIQLGKIVFNNFNAQYCNLQQNMLVQAGALNLKLKGSLVASQLDAKLSADIGNLLVNMPDSIGSPKVYANLREFALTLAGEGSKDDLSGKFKLFVSKGDFALGGHSYTTEAMQQSRGGLLALNIPFQADLGNKSFTMGEETHLSLVDYSLGLWGNVTLANEKKPMNVDLHYNIDQWQVANLLSVLPQFLTTGLAGMDIDARVSLQGTTKGVVADGRLPLVETDVTLEKGRFVAPKILPAPLRNIRAQLFASLNLSSDSASKGPSNVRIANLSAKLGKSNFAVSGTVDDLLGNMLVDAGVKASLNLPDLSPFLPDTLPVSVNGTAKADLKVKSRLSDLQGLNLKKMVANGTLDFSRLDVVYDSIHATSPELSVAISLPTRQTGARVHELLGARITGGSLDVEIPSNGLMAKVENPVIKVALPDILDKKQALAAAFDISFSKVDAKMDSTLVYSDTLLLKGSVCNDTTKDNPIAQWSPDLDISIHRGVLAMAGMSDPVRLTDFEFNYRPKELNIARADILWGVSDYHLQGKVNGLEDWINHAGMLVGEINFTSQYADVDQLMDILSGMGSDADTLSQQRQEDNVPAEANPFIVPRDVDVKFGTHITRCVAFGNDLNDLAGSVTINDGTTVLDQVGFTCKAARMELTGVYKSPRVNNLFLGLDFHLLDIQIEELLDMIPSIDTLVPMLAAFRGKADFHLAAECNLDAFYRPKMSQLIGAAAISGKNLVVMDNATVAQLAKLLQFKNWREKDNSIGVDSLSVEAVVLRKEVRVYPFLLNLHNYQLCIDGRHTLDNNCNYHLELLHSPLPVRLAVDVGGNIKHPDISLGKVQYAELYKPEKQDQLQARTIEIKKLVRQALEANVRRQH